MNGVSINIRYYVERISDATLMLIRISDKVNCQRDD